MTVVFILIATLTIIFLLAYCGVEKAIEKLFNEINSLKSKYSQLNDVVIDLNAKNECISKQTADLYEQINALVDYLDVYRVLNHARYIVKKKGGEKHGKKNSNI